MGCVSQLCQKPRLCGQAGKASLFPPENKQFLGCSVEQRLTQPSQGLALHSQSCSRTCLCAISCSQAFPIVEETLHCLGKRQ